MLRARIEAETQDNELGPPNPNDFGFWHDFGIVEQAVDILRASNWVSWPESPVWMENDQKWIDDILTYIALERRMRWEVENGINSAFETQETSADQRRFGVDEL